MDSLLNRMKFCKHNSVILVLTVFFDNNKKIIKKLVLGTAQYSVLVMFLSKNKYDFLLNNNHLLFLLQIQGI